MAQSIKSQPVLKLPTSESIIVAPSLDLRNE